MSEFSGVFDQLADALKSSGASPSTTLRQHRPPRRHPHTQTFASRPIPPAPTPLEPVIVAPTVVPPKPPRKVDRSRDHAVYAAPHRPSRPHFHSRPDDIVTERILRRAIATANRARRSVPVVVLAAFALTVALGLGVFLSVAR